LKWVKVLYPIVAAFVVLSLFGGSLAEWLDSGIGAGWRFADRMQNAVFVMLCRVIGAVGVIWLGWYWLKLAGGIASMARQLTQDKQGPIRASGSAVLNEMADAVNRRLSCYSDKNVALEEEAKNLQIQIQLSQKQKRNTEAIIYSIRDAVIVIDEFDKLLMANEAAGRLLDFDFRNSQYKPIGDLIDAGNNELTAFLKHCRQRKARAARREIEFLENAKPKTFDTIVSCVYDERERVCGVVAVLHDITREKEISQMKNDFVSHVSHELKTPLASITAYSEMLCEGEAEDERTRQEFYGVIQSQAKRLNRMIEDILNISRIESGLIKIQKKPVSLTILIEEQLQMIKGYAEEKNIEVIGQRPIVFDQVYIDGDMMAQVIVNLLSNAVKYTPAGGTVKIETEVDEIARMARVSVTDTGVGIPEDEIEHVFDKFYRVEANKSQAKGTGLGLNLVKQIVESVHNGRVFVSSRPGEGSKFGFELPLATADTVEVAR
jgi:two-component system phosphate regulon sensor histidine kinase PhoR